jgi:signal transduction histidine kinase/CheY-like chemotaxis protein
MIASIFALILIKPDVHIKRTSFAKMQCVFFVLSDVVICFILESVCVLLFLLLVQSVLMVIFLDKSLYYFQTLIVAVVLAIMGFMAFVVKIPIEPLGREHFFGVVCVFTVQWISIKVVRLFNMQNRHMLEQEQSLDDMLRILEVKCLEARQATKSKSDFLSNMSHEIRTPINSVLGMNEMILRECKDENILDYASNIDSSGRMLLSLINDVLDFSKIESGNMEIVPTTYQTSEFLNDLLNMIWVPVKEKGLGFILEIDNNLPRELFGDDVRIRQVFTNLLTNAIKYTEEGTVTLKIEGDVINNFKVMLHCEVRDTGRGIKDEDMPNLFRAFRRIEEKKSRNIIGTGLGLPITYHILETMGSHLEVDSIYGVGSVFSFSLEQDIVDDTPIEDFRGQIRTHASSKNYKASLYAPDAKVLVVDDNEMNRKVFINLLKAPQIQVTQADSGKACLKLVKEQKFDLIFLDHMMPEMDGIETLHHLKKMDHINHVPVVALTANAISGAREMYLAEGFDAFLSKPIMPDKLEKMLMDLLPRDKILETPDIPENEEMETAEMEEELPMIDGIDWNFAMTHFPDQKMLLHTLEDFYKMIMYEADKLDGFYKRIDEEGQMDEYRIQVHGMKSSAALVGIIPLSGCAKMLEDAAKRSDLETILQVTPVFLREWKGFRERLSQFAGEMPDEEAKKDDNSELLALLGMLQGAAESMDIDTMDEMMEQIPQYQMSEEDLANLETLKIAVMNLETEVIIEMTDSWIEKIRNK